MDSINKKRETELSPIAERFLFSMEQINVTGYKLKQNGVIKYEGTLTKIKKGIHQPSRKMLDRYLNCYKQINPAWLFTGEGQPLLDSSKSTEQNVIFEAMSPNANELYLETKSGMKYYKLSEDKFKMRVPFVPYKAYARYICDIPGMIEAERDQWEEIDFIVDKIGHGNYLAFEIKGDSMDDDSKRSFSHGDKVLVRELNRIYWKDGIRYKQYPYWVIVTGSTILCKQIINHDIENNRITCHSLNPSPEYHDFVLDLDEVYGLFNIIQKVPVAINYE